MPTRVNPRISIFTFVFVIAWFWATPILLAVFLGRFIPAFNGAVYILSLLTCYAILLAVTLLTETLIRQRFPIPEQVLKKDEEAEEERARRSEKFWRGFNVIRLDGQTFTESRKYRASRQSAVTWAILIVLIFGGPVFFNWNRATQRPMSDTLGFLGILLLLVALVVYPSVLNFIKIDLAEVIYRDFFWNRSIPTSKISELGLDVGISVRNENFYIAYKNHHGDSKLLRVPLQQFDNETFAQVTNDIIALNPQVKLNEDLSWFISRAKEMKGSGKSLSRLPYQPPVPPLKQAKIILQYLFYSFLLPLLGLLVSYAIKFLSTKG